MTLSLDTAAELLDFEGRSRADAARGRLGPEAARNQLEGAVALRNILEKRGFAYLADEVGMGKTYVALGVLALFRHFQPDFRVLIIAPRANIQRKWHKELKNFVANNVRFADLRVKAVHGGPARPIVLCDSLLELVRETALDTERDFIMRMSSFSLGLGDDSDRWKTRRDELLKHLPWLERSDFDLRNKDQFKDDYARAVCCALPTFDLVIIDEGHNLKHGFGESVAYRNRLLGLAFGHPDGKVSDQRFRTYGPRARRVLFLSATPLENDYRQLWNQLDVLGIGANVTDLKRADLPEETKRGLVEAFLIRRVTALRVAGKRLTKNVYRREWRNGGVETHDDPLRVADDRQRLVVALMQKKVAEVLGNEKFNNSFQIGMLASFESFLETTRVWKGDSDGTPGNFDDEDQTQDQGERLGIDVSEVNRIARSYRHTFTNEELPHPKMDAVVDALAQNFDAGRKALVFVRRIKSVTELQRRLERRYDEWLFRRLEAELRPELWSSLKPTIAQYREEQARRGGPVEGAKDGVDEGGDIEAEVHLPERQDRGGTETFFAWFFRGEGPRGLLSGARLQQRLVGTSATFFEDNHVAGLLGAAPGGVYRALVDYLGVPEEPTRATLMRTAATHLKPGDVPRQQSFLSMQHAALSLIARRAGPLRRDAEWLLHERYPHLAEHQRHRTELDPRQWLEVPTFWTELRRRPGLRARLWPESQRPDPRPRIRENELRRELISAMARLGHALIDLYVLAVNRIGSLALRARAGTGEESDALVNAYLDVLESQMRSTGPEFRAFHELTAGAEHFDLILDVNAPDARDERLEGAATEFGRLLRAQQPIGGMFGEINNTLVRQFRMPGYPFALITTDLLQEGEDLHTFCSSVYHYGISWTPSAMEQRIGRVDRVNSDTERRLTSLPQQPSGEELLQVYFPHLRDTVEVLQVERVLERMNRFLRLMHLNLGQPDSYERHINVSTEAVRVHRDIEQIGTPLETAFGVRPELLRGDRRKPAVSRNVAASMARRFHSLPERLKVLIDVRWEPSSSDNLLLGTVHRTHRVQPFVLVLRSLSGHGIVRCISPVGVLGPGDDPSRITTATGGQRLRICALVNAHTESYDLTIEDDVLLGDDERHDADRIEGLLRRVTAQADRLEEILLKIDQPMITFRDDLSHEGDG
ncbi:MAG: DEAD/DEAH box helicase family protein [Candidatus Rokubacteria bacterium]|nr:DEAD/DEAH box helicase family protein [Candidatus Rokubacteria bacterium]